MKILFITSEYFPVENAVSIRTWYNAQALKNSGNEVEILTGKGAMKIDENDVPVNTIKFKPPSNKSGFLTRLINEIWFGFCLSCYIIRLKKIDHIIITSPPFFMTLICVLSCRMKKFSYSVDIRDRYPQVFFSLGILKYNGIIGCILRKMENYIYKNAKHVITVTEGLSDRIEKEMKIRNVAIVMNGYTDGIVVKQTSKTESTVKIIMHGNFGKFFDEEIFIKITESLLKTSMDYRISIIGGGSKIDILKQRNIPNVEIFDEMPHEKLAKLLMNADIGLSIHTDDESMKYAFPVKVFEFIGAGLPSIVIPMNEAGRTISSEGFGYSFSKEEWKGAVEALTLLIQNKDKRQLISGEIIKKRKIYKRSAQAEKFAEILTS